VNSIAPEDQAYVQRLVDILREQAPQTLGELRRGHGLDPIKLNQTVNSYPFLFEGKDVLKGRNPFPTLSISLRKEPEPEPVVMPEIEVKIRAALKGTGENGLTLGRLHHRFSISSQDAIAFAQEHAGWCEIIERFDQQKRKKLFIRLRLPTGKPEPVAPKVFHDGRWIDPSEKPSDQLKQDCFRLCAILREGARLSSWLEPQIAWSRVEEIALVWPDLLQFEKSGNGREWFVGLKPETVEPIETIGVTPPENKPREPLAEPSYEEKKKMSWKPSSRHQHAGQSTDPKAYQHRVRHPLVEL
jgi:hypothetical protein